MWVIAITGYLVVGLTVAGFTLAIFPPQEGYRPPLKWLVLAIVSYVVLWPFLAMIGLGYLVGQWYQPTSPPSAAKSPVGPPKRSHFYRALYDEAPN